MTATNIITLIVFIIVACIMIGIGISQLRSTTPVGFYSGEKGPAKDELIDVQAWNRKHGIMWLVYGAIIIVSYFCGYMIGDNVLCVIPYCGGLIMPIFFMIRYHHKLIKRYKQ
ncbi:MAG: hypothetical protein EOM40_12700 [Clostridia bacterium]|nr:hypothetical protein [Clostridia bacterium]